MMEGIGDPILCDADEWMKFLEKQAKLHLKPIFRYDKVFDINEFHNVPIMEDRQIRWYPFGFSREQFMRDYLLPAVRHYKVKRE